MVDVVINVDLLNIVIGLITALIYSWLGYLASGESFDGKKFMHTILLAFLVALGLDSSGLTGNIYVAAFSPTAITVILQKLYGTGQQTATKMRTPVTT